jgi:hypothetical protein
VLKNGSIAIDARFEAASGGCHSRRARRFAALPRRETILSACSFLLPSSFDTPSSLLRQRDRAYEAMAVAGECTGYRTRVARRWCRSGRHLQRLQRRRFDHPPLSPRFVGSAGCVGCPGRSGRSALQRGREPRAAAKITLSTEAPHATSRSAARA